MLIPNPVPYRQRVRRRWIGSIMALIGAGILIALIMLQPPIRGRDLWVSWIVFTASFAVLEMRSVEVNDRLYLSSSIMPLLTGGVVFALQTDSALLAMTLMAMTGPFVPEDFRSHRVFQPAVNLGQLVVSASAAGVVLEMMLRNADSSTFLPIAIAGAAAALVYTIVNFGLVRIIVGFVYGTKNLVPWSKMTSLFTAQVSMGFLGGMLGALLLETAPAGSAPGSPLTPLVLGVYVIGHLVYTSYARLREAHEDSLKGFVKTLETRDLYTRGHTERVATFSQMIGDELRFTGTQQERMRWAALIHDMGKLAVPGELLSKQSSLTDDEYRILRNATHSVDDLLSEVDFLKPMVDVASGCHPRLAHEDFGQHGHHHTTSPTLEQKVLAVADAFDAMISSRSYRMAISQPGVFESLYATASPLYDREVIRVLEKAIADSGGSFGPPGVALLEEQLEAVRNE